MKRWDLRAWLFAIVAGLAVAAFLRLAAWQLERLGERRDLNAERAALAELPPIELGPDTPFPPVDSLLWRRVHLTGTWQFDREIVIRGRAALGSPGVHLLTPVRRDHDASVLVLRGWLPAADGLSADLRSARPGDGEEAPPADVVGVALPGEASAAVPPRLSRFDDDVHLVLASIDFDAIHMKLEEPILDVWILPDSVPDVGAEVKPRRVERPPPSDGPHLMYAIQWLGFATITAAGTIVFLVTRHRDANRNGRTT
jgi:surfeit locus 1 family protein